MFTGFDNTADAIDPRRMAASTALSAMLLAGAATALLLAGRKAVGLAEPVDVSLRAPAPKASPAPPPPVIPQNVPVKRVAMAARPAPTLVAPKEMPKEAPPEAEPTDAPVEVDDGSMAGSGDGAVSYGTQVASVQAAPPPPPRRRRDPIQLPESAKPPIPLGSNLTPEFPEEARAKGFESTVILKIVVDDEGNVDNVQVLRGDEPFVAAAVRAVRTWRYEPALVDGVATSVFRIVKIPFLLKS